MTSGRILPYDGPEERALIQQFYRWRWMRVSERMVGQLQDVRRRWEALVDVAEARANDAEARARVAFVNGFVLGVAAMLCLAIWIQALSH